MSTRPSFSQDDFFAFSNRLSEYSVAESEATLADFFRAVLPALHAATPSGPSSCGWAPAPSPTTTSATASARA